MYLKYTDFYTYDSEINDKNELGITQSFCCVIVSSLIYVLTFLGIFLRGNLQSNIGACSIMSPSNLYTGEKSKQARRTSLSLSLFLLERRSPWQFQGEKRRGFIHSPIFPSSSRNWSRMDKQMRDDGSDTCKKAVPQEAQAQGGSIGKIFRLFKFFQKAIVISFFLKIPLNNLNKLDKIRFGINTFLEFTGRFEHYVILIFVMMHLILLCQILYVYYKSERRLACHKCFFD